MKLTITELPWTKEDRSNYAALCSEIVSLRTKNKAKKEEVPQYVTKKEKQVINTDWVARRKVAGERVRELRNQMQELCMMFYGAKLEIGKHHVIKEGWQDKREFAKTLHEGVKKKFEEIKRKRRESRVMDTIRRDHNGFSYKITGHKKGGKMGGVFTEPGTILKLVGTVSDDDRLKAEKRPLSFKKENYVGVELELVCKCSREYLMDCIIVEKLQSYVQIKSDSSINADETHRYSYEVVVMAEEREIHSIVERLCKVLKMPRISALANNSCGLHVHLDMRNRNVSECYKKLYYSQTILLNMVPADRREGDHANRYCKKNTTADFEEQRKHERYYVINAQAYDKYKTLEIRVHGGSVNATKINNWISVLSGIVNGTVPETHLKQHIGKFCEHFNIAPDLKVYIEKRTNKFTDGKIDTKSDNLEAA